MYLSAVANHLTYVQAIILGVLQGVTELFPVSSLGHSVICLLYTSDAADE